MIKTPLGAYQMGAFVLSRGGTLLFNLADLLDSTGTLRAVVLTLQNGATPYILPWTEQLGYTNWIDLTLGERIRLFEDNPDSYFVGLNNSNIDLILESVGEPRHTVRTASTEMRSTDR